MRDKLSFFLLIGISLLVVFSLVNAFLVLGMGSKMDKKIADLKEAARPGKITLTMISPVCDGCTDISPLIESVKGSKINITEEKTLNEKTGAQLISKYGITKLPAIIIEGETSKISASGFEQKDGALVFSSLPAPYYDVTLKKVIGKVDVWRIEPPACDDCTELEGDMEQIVDVFSEQGVFFTTNAELMPASAEGKKMISENGIKKLPALIFSDEISAYPEVLVAMTQGGFRKAGDLHVYESTLPYYNLSSQEVRGLVDITMLSDGSCEECYDVTLHTQILKNSFGMTLGKQSVIDISSAQGKALLSKYAIESVPAVVLTRDVKLYRGFDTAWKSVGTIEDDGSYVFRDSTALGQGFPYKDLASGEIKNTIPQ